MLDTWPAFLVKTDLIKKLDAVLPAIRDELGRAIDDRFGMETSKWVEVPLDTVRMVVAQAAARYNVGTELCRDEEYLRDVVYITDGMPRNAILVGSGPAWLKPLVGFLVSFTVRRRLAKLTRKIRPMFQRRLAFLDQPEGKHPDEPRDFFQMMLRYAQRERPEELASLPIMATRLCIANFTSVHQTSFAAMNLVLNMAASDPEYDTLSSLRREFQSVIGQEAKSGSAVSWTKSNAQQLVKADSLCRESLRLHAFPQRFAPRTIMVDGLKTPDGHDLPKGTVVTFFAGPVHRDPDVYRDPLKFDPWRYEKRRDESGHPETESLVSVTSDFLSWGRGRHSCSGRQLVDFELKMLISHLFMNYDIKLPERYGGRRPENVWSAEVEFPPQGISLMVRRRQAGNIV